MKITINRKDVEHLIVSRMSSFVDGQPGRFEKIDDNKYSDEQMGIGSLLWVDDNYLHAAVVRNYQLSKGFEAKILYDVCKSDPRYCIWTSELFNSTTKGKH